MILNSSVQKVLDAARIEDVVRDYVDLKPRGSNLTGLCPFHKEKTPSFSVSPSKNIYKCFGCGKAGGPVQFVMESEQYSFPEAIRQLAKRYQIELEETAISQEAKEEMLEVQGLNIINEFAAKYYEDQLWNTELGKSIGLSYFKERSFLETTLRKFNIGYAGDGYRAFTDHSLAQGYSADLLKKLGLTSTSDKDFFRNRVMFPIHNQSGKVVGFAGRIMSSEIKVAKYINSPESEVYKKSKTLFGLNIAKNAIRKHDQCILVEGYTDVMSLVQSGIENVVASSGTSLTEDQAHILKRHTNNILILYDGDSAGIKAAVRGIDIIIKEGLNVQIGMIPDQDDPDSFIRKVGFDGFQSFLKNDVKDFIIFKINLLRQEAKNDPIAKAAAINDIVGTISKIEDGVKRSLYMQQAAQILDISELTLISSCNKLIKEDLKQKAFQQKRQALDRDEMIVQEQDHVISFKDELQLSFSSGDEIQEREIVKILVLEGSTPWRDTNFTVAHFLIENISDVLEYFDNSFYALLINETHQKLNEGQTINLEYFINHPTKQVSHLAIELSSSPYVYSENWAAKHGIFLTTNATDQTFSANEIEKLIKHLKYRKFDKVIKRLDQQIKDTLDLGEQMEIIKAREDLKKTKNMLYSEVWALE